MQMNIKCIFIVYICFARAVEETYRDEEVNPPLPLTRRNLDHCPCCNMAVWDGEPYKRDIPRLVCDINFFPPLLSVIQMYESS